MDIEKSYEDKVCIVTGAASGLGLALSEALLEAGATVFMADRDGEALSASVQALGTRRGRAQAEVVDETVSAQVQDLVDAAVARCGRVEFLFNNAGVGGTLPFEQVTLAHWERLVAVNLWSIVHGIQAVLPTMRRQRRGHIVNTSSVAGLVPFPMQAIDCATKFAVTGLSESLRLELADEGIHVTVACPGNVATRFLGTPIFGERAAAAPPADAISAREAAHAILGGAARKEGIVVFPEGTRKLWDAYRHHPEEVERLLEDMARQRRQGGEALDSHP